MDTSVLLVLVICAAFLGLLAGSRMRMMNRVVMFMVCYIVAVGLVAFYTGQDFNTLLYAPLAPLFGGQNTTVMAEVGNLSVGNATTSFQMNGNTYTVTNATVTNGSAVWINGTALDPNSPLNPIMSLFSIFMYPFQWGWAGALITFSVWFAFIYFIYGWIHAPLRERENYYTDYSPPARQNTPPPDPPRSQAQTQAQPPAQAETSQDSKEEEKKPKKRDRYETIKV